jgi:thiosulfate dehydrogenase [quinone] large subunit
VLTPSGAPPSIEAVGKPPSAGIGFQATGHANMVESTTPTRPAFGWHEFRAMPLRGLGIGLTLALRVLYGLFYLFAAVNKFQHDYLFSDYLRDVLIRQLGEIDPESFGTLYLEHFAIPFYRFCSWFVAWGETAVAIGLLLGLCTRWAGALALWITINIALSGMADASLLVLGLLALLFIVLPTGHWRGLDRTLHSRHPRSILFR